ncbi:MAG TPA: DHH family phosphoesterase, partial [Pseudogracilibacillus sp.]|nr:DHH family phosphoesterase [Pseudogracilibacillus sp.]
MFRKFVSIFILATYFLKFTTINANRSSFSDHGYGITKKTVDEVLKLRPTTQVIVTTDNGSNAIEGVQYAKEKGIIVLVTDHHIAESDVGADAEINPNHVKDNTYPYKAISGTTVIYKALFHYANTY